MGVRITRGDGTTLQHDRKNVAFTGGAGIGAIGTVDLFTVTGVVWIAAFMASCTENLAGATATLAIGTVSVLTDLFMAQITATNLTNTQLWTDGLISGEALQIGSEDTDVMCLANIRATVGTANITNGTIDFDLWYRPVTDNGLVVAA